MPQFRQDQLQHYYMNLNIMQGHYLHL